MAFNSEIYYARLVRETLKTCHLAELRKWLAGGSDACQTPDKMEPCIHTCARTWLGLFNAVPIAPAARKKRAAEPYAMFKAMLAHPWCVAHLDALLGAEEDDGWTISVTSILARVPQGSRLIQRCLAASPNFALSKWHPSPHRDADRIGFGGAISHIYLGLIPKALRSSTLDDVKRLLRLGEYCVHADGSESKERLALETFRRSESTTNAVAECLRAVEWSAAAANPRNDVYAFAVQQWAANDSRHARAWFVAGMSQARFKALFAAWPRNAMDALVTYAEALSHGGVLTFPPALCAGLAKDECGGVGAYLTPTYLTARAARDAKVLLAPDWPTRLLAACAQPRLPDWHDGAHKGCCPRARCGASCGVRALMSDDAFTALDSAARLQVLASIMGLTMHMHAVERWRYPTVITWVGRAQCLAHLISGGRPKDGPDPAAFIHALTVATRVSARWGDAAGATPLERLKRFIGANDFGEYATGYGIPGVQAALALARTLEGGAELRIEMHRGLMVHLNRLVRLREAVRAHFLRVWKDRSRVIGADIAMMPPDRKTCPTGGTSYREGLLSYRLGPGGGGGAFRSPPVPATPESLAWYVTHPATYSVKADGVSYEGPLPAAYPALADDCDFDPGAWTVRAEEMVVETNRGPRALFLVFDAVGASSYTDTLCERMAFLRRAHQFAPLSPTYTADSDALSAFLRHLPEGGCARVWWPKWVGLLGADPAASLQMLSEQPRTSYKNDGWILTPHAEQCQLIGGSHHPADVKVKPPREMTADLCIGGGQTVWRCTWAAGKGWEPREARPEKRHPNPPEIVAFLESFHRHPWSPSELAPFIQHAHYRAGGIGSLSSATGQFLRAQRELQAARLAPLCAGARVLDVGAGRGRVARLVGGSSKPLCWVGLDTDPVAVEDARLRPETQNHTWLWCDAGTLAHPLTRERPLELGATYDVLLALHSIHHAASDEKTWQAWAQNLTKLAAPGCTLVIATVDPTRLPVEPTELPDLSFIRPVKSLVVGASAYRISLAWANSAVAPVTEHYFAPARLAEDLAQLGWELASLRRGPTAQKWEAWADAHVWLVFRLWRARA